MHCIFCGNNDTDVVETRTSDDGMTVRRRRECSKCVKRFTTYERVEQLPIIVVKRDGRRERFDRDKLKSGMLKSTGKTTITLEQVEEIVNSVESDLKQEDTTEVASQKIGELVAKYLKKLDKIAYIRFASVFRRFVDVEDFEKEVKKLL
ncbi:transcriptional regulator NrdR [Candidatus Roizmanbacteria bacterium RIFCSPHIGHO2_12_FULL_44_10]|uniref:Transcriptional repressor NrdR n=1 Tax=Candidatus Roizmanbacteria bacterium RIFCSPHIGHO2_12_FULL_44_10 TaxID=1802054 RepID=A0A1F7I5A5_9BACT|nr:MAG: transcriptional regulator NrdR [Candidatus Roizmanbacteria bacterium RIFCSPHIGHO2_12_FULL_44_10]